MIDAILDSVAKVVRRGRKKKKKSCWENMFVKSLSDTEIESFPKEYSAHMGSSECYGVASRCECTCFEC